MMKKILMTATAAAAMSFGVAGAANAGELQLELRNVNIGDADHTDTNIGFETLCDGSLVFGLTACTFEQTVEAPFPGLPNAVWAIERFVDALNHPIEGHFEVDLNDDTDLPSIRENSTISITLSGTANPTWKDNFSVPELIRPGSDSIFSSAAEPIENVVEGGTTASFIFTPGDTVTENPVTGDIVTLNAREEAVGFLLPIQVTTCGNVDVTITVTTTAAVAGGTGGATQTNERSATTTILDCNGSVAPKIAEGGAKIDYREDFKSFSVLNESTGAHDQTTEIVIGELGLTTLANLVDLKAPKNPDNDNLIQEAIFDARSDIAQIDFDLVFDSLLGIKYIMLGDRVTHRVTGDEYLSGIVSFSLDNGDLRSLLPDVTRRIRTMDKGDMNMDTFPVKLIAFPAGERSGPKEIEVEKGVFQPSGIGIIEHQDVRVANIDVTFDPEKQSGVPLSTKVKFDGDLGLILAGEALLGTLESTGLNFGPFDWVSDGTDGTMHVFRLTHVPLEDGHGNPLDTIKYNLTVKGPTAGPDFEQTFKCSIDNPLNKELVIASADLVACAGNFLRADLSFTFVFNPDTLPGGKEAPVDMDRLMVRLSGGAATPFGDNANDGFSLKAQSCDEGRFGPHVDNKLLNQTKDDITFLCSANRLSETFGPAPSQ